MKIYKLLIAGLACTIAADLLALDSHGYRINLKSFTLKKSGGRHDGGGYVPVVTNPPPPPGHIHNPYLFADVFHENKNGKTRQFDHVADTAVISTAWTITPPAGGVQKFIRVSWENENADTSHNPTWCDLYFARANWAYSEHRHHHQHPYSEDVDATAELVSGHTPIHNVSSVTISGKQRYEGYIVVTMYPPGDGKEEDVQMIVHIQDPNTKYAWEDGYGVLEFLISP